MIESKTFIITDETKDGFETGYKYIEECYAEFIPKIKQAMGEGKQYIRYLKPLVNPRSFYETHMNCKIQWD